jgi:hypothetical protein
MHRSRLFALFFDTPAADARRAADFWAQALGAPARPDADEPQFIMLHGALAELRVGVQAVDDAPRYHVDIETDDLDAEVARLAGLGAVEVARWLDCHLLRAPSDHLVCVIPVHSDPEFFVAHARVWP